MPNKSLTWMMPLFHTHHKVCVIRTLITTKTLFYSANADENSFFHIVSRGNLLNSRTFWQSRTCTKEASSSKQNKCCWHCSLQNMKTSCILKYFGLKIYQNEYRMDNNGKTSSDIEASRPVLWYKRVPV